MRLSTLRSIAGLLTAGSLLVACGQTQDAEGPQRLVRVAEAQPLDLSVSQTFPGLASATQEANLSFRVGGHLIERPAYVGMQVAEGDILAALDPDDFILAVQNLEGQLARHQASLRHTEAEYQRLVNIQTDDPGATSQTAIDRGRQAYEGDLAAVQSSNANLTVAKNQLAYTELIAPFSGRVVATYTENFQGIVPKEPVVRLLDTSTIEMVIYVPEQSMPLLIQEVDLTVTFDLYPQNVLPATVKELGTEAQTVTRTYPVTLTMEPPEGIVIFAGLAGKAHLSMSVDCPEACGLHIPATAVVSDHEGNNYVWVVDKHDQEVHQRYVKLGRLQDDGILITEGLDAGDKVVTAGVHYVHEGQKVKTMGSVR